MSTTLRAIMQRVGFWLESQDTWLVSTAGAGGSTTQLIDTTYLKSSGYRGSTYLGATVRFADSSIAAANMFRLVESDTPSTGTLTWAQALATSATGQTYELWAKWNPRLVLDAVNVALGRMTYTTDDALTLVTDQLNYALATDFAWVTREDQVLAVVVQSGTTANVYTYADREGIWQVREDAGAFWVDFLEGFNSTTTDVVLLRTLRSYASKDGTLALSQDVCTAPLDWVAVETCLVLCEQREGQALPEERGVWTGEVAYWEGRARRWRNTQGPKVRRPMMGHSNEAAQAPSGYGAW